MRKSAASACVSAVATTRYISALRRGEGGARSKIDAFELDQDMGALRVHPFVGSRPRPISTSTSPPTPTSSSIPFMRMGFLTIGCFPCTTPVRDDEPERAGRWRHLAGVDYCGINPTDRARPRKTRSSRSTIATGRLSA